MSQLLGRTDDKLQSFAQDVGRFHRGEPLISIQDVEDDVKLPPALPERTYDATKPKASSSDRRNEATGKNSFQQTIPKAASNPPPPKAASMPPTTTSSSTAKVKSSATSKTVPTPNEALPPPVLPPPPKSHPSMGTASTVCGCFGSVHKPLTNCLYCGRISCEREGYDYCPFCGLLVEQVSGEEGYVFLSGGVQYGYE